MTTELEEQPEPFDIHSLDPDGLTSVAILIGYIDKKVMTILQDGSIYIGFLRTFDQYGTILLHKTIERIYIESDYGEIPLGVFLIRSDNIVLIGEIEPDKEYPVGLNLLPKEYKYLRLSFDWARVISSIQSICINSTIGLYNYREIDF